ncbi:MAG: MBL fold metallo-hydrolase [Terrimicrobiaceae bacterium]
MEVVVLGTGSSGNSSLVISSSSVILVDAGLSSKKLESRMADAGVDPLSLSGILLTHEHADHAGGLKVFLSRWRVPLYCNAETARALGGSGAFPGAEFRLFETGASFSLGDFAVRSFAVPHDASEPVGFRIESGGEAFGVLTDLGFATRLAIESLRGVSGLLIEANHDETLLQNDKKRPWSVKQRIASRHGHLSNAAASEVVAELAGPAMKHVVLGHLSRDCNTPEMATQAVMERLGDRLNPPLVQCSGQDTSVRVSVSNIPH